MADLEAQKKVSGIGGGGRKFPLDKNGSTMVQKNEALEEVPPAQKPVNFPPRKRSIPYGKFQRSILDFM